jgi:Domain of unknown function (DUF4365)
MDDSVLNIIDRILRFRRNPPSTTARLAGLGHDRYLLPTFKEQIEQVLESYGKFLAIAYDTQGIRDQGIDLAIRLRNEEGVFTSLIGFQIKSTWDLLQDGYLQKLKAQHYDSSQVRKLQHYYIVICVDEEKNKRRLREIAAEFKTASRTTVIEPGYADVFLALPPERIDAYIKRILAPGDIIIKKAREAISSVNRMSAAVLLELTVLTHFVKHGPVEMSLLKSSVALQDFHALLSEQTADITEIESDADDEVITFEEPEVDPYFEDAIVQSVDSLEDQSIIVEGDMIKVEFEQVAAILALAMEALVRYEYQPSAITPYLIDVLGLAD